MLYTITNSGIQNGRPTKIGANSVNIDWNGSHVFTVENFTTETTPSYSDPEGDALAYIKILSLPSEGELLINGNPVSVGEEISAGQLTTSNLTYQANDQITNQQVLTFTFDCADVGSTSLSGLSDGIFTINVAAKENLPPDVVGDKTVVSNYGETITFTASDFTDGTVPAYNDPEGDSPSKIKILDLPNRGTLQFNGIDVVANQEMTVSEVDSGYLVWIPDLLNQLSVNTSFNFAVSDTGSGQFTQ